MTKFTKEYSEFREKLSNDQIVNFQHEIMVLLGERAIKENTLTVVELGGKIRFNIYVDKKNDVVWLLGGHWVRHGEPSKKFLDRMNHYADEIVHGREPI